MHDFSLAFNAQLEIQDHQMSFNTDLTFHDF